MGRGGIVMRSTTRSACAGDLPVNPYDLVDAVNASSQPVRRSWLAFVAVWTYLMLVVASVTHRDLLFSSDVTLPLLNVKLELTRFFLVAPATLLALHLGLIAQALVLAKKAAALDTALRMLEATDRPTHPLRLEIGGFSLVQVIAGPDRGLLLAALLNGVCWLVLAVLPVTGLLFIQATFLPYHDETVTWAHRSMLVFDVAALGAAGILLLGRERALGAAVRSALRCHPIRAAAGGVAGALAAALSLTAFTIPGEPIEHHGSALAGFQEEPGGAGASAGNRRALLGLVPRNLELPDLDIPDGQRINLRHRDLRLARLDRGRLRNADLAGANLDGASLAGADLAGASLGCVREASADVRKNGSRIVCASARGADFSGARLIGVQLAGLDLTDARLPGADLTGARLPNALMMRANLAGAWLEKADLSGARLRGAVLTSASLSGADLSRADLSGADLSKAALRAAVLVDAGLEAAAFAGADLEAAALGGARLFASDLSSARLRAASLREARVWGTLPPQLADTELAELAGLDVAPPAEAEREAVLSSLHASDTSHHRNARERLLTGTDTSAAAWSALVDAGAPTAGEARVIGALVPTGSRISGPETPAAPGTDVPPGAQRQPGDRRASLTRYLIELACRETASDGAFATGIARRAAQPHFDGDAAVVLESLRKPECRGGLAVPADVLARLAHTVDRLSTR